MTTKKTTIHQVQYFKDIDTFCPIVAPKTHKETLPPVISNYFRDLLGTLRETVKDGESSIPTYLRHSKTAVLIYEDLEVEAIAENAHFHELILFYDDPPGVRVGPTIKELSHNQNDWYVISMSSPKGMTIIRNYVIQGINLATTIILLSKLDPCPVQELLAYRTQELYASLILACSKPF